MNSRTTILDGALALLRAGKTVSLESAAVQAGLTKPGLMHHFRTKSALMLALVDHAVDRWERELAERLQQPPAEASARDRVIAYLDWTLSGTFDTADLVMLADPRLRDQLTLRWQERLKPWIGPDVPPDARCTAVRLLADGAWLAEATGIFPMAADERDRIRDLAMHLLDDTK
ncbi:TetR/AcrR family transcriptional regulator [Kribbella albertanoniae]|uniref:TetR/AcrR family transcriptional regulator n=1 Tax=Kribbella albertanoniae TaxID=1266829 RepID=A0A4R4Q088_9ACTN|nr:TetR/AcrR family transcriptional regulator [Kribbella albertanoniae]TDC28153.1 TetR/AcrR family transcriptional regulator [Kribbella albertanoniae]